MLERKIVPDVAACQFLDHGQGQQFHKHEALAPQNTFPSAQGTWYCVHISEVVAILLRYPAQTHKPIMRNFT